MIDLDTRARQAARGLKQQVSDTAMTLAVPPTERPRQALLAHPAWSMAAGALAALVLLVGLWVARPTVVADESDEIFVPLVTTTTDVAVTTAPAEPVDSVAPAGPPASEVTTTTDSPSGETGSLDLQLVVGDDIMINEVAWTISSPGMDDMEGTINTSAPGATACCSSSTRGTDDPEVRLRKRRSHVR